MSKVLVLSYLPVYPANDGGSVRIHDFAANLAKKHDVVVVCPRLSDRPDVPLPYRLCDIGGVGRWCQIVDPGFVVRLLRLVRRERPDAILLEYVWQGFHASLIHAITGVPVLLDAFDVVTVRFQRERHPWLPLISLYERMMLKIARQVFAISDVDRRRLLRLGVEPDKVSVVPGGIDIDVFHPDTTARGRVRTTLGVRDDEGLLLFFGQLAYPPNRDALEVLCRHILPLLEPSFRLIVAGRGPIDELRATFGGPRVSFLGPVERIADYINAADAVVAPIRRGSGTRRKLLESAACGVPVVTTTIGAEGLDSALLGDRLIIRDDWPSFASAVASAAGQPRQVPGQAFFDMHDWSRVIERVELNGRGNVA